MAREKVTRSRLWIAIGLSFALLLGLLAVLPLIGSAHIDYTRAWNGLSPDHEILFAIRLPRVLLAMLAGGAFGVCGVLFQALLRDALADPTTLGIASGAALGAVAAICFGFSTVWPAAFVGAGLTLFLVLGIASQGRRMSSFTLLMAGVTINSICLALILFLHTLANFNQSFAITRWLMGGIEPPAYSTLIWIAAVILPAVLYLFWKSRQWNLLAVGEEWAAARGVSTSGLMLSGYLIGSLLTGCVTALTGPIGFVGLIIPHALRLAFGADHRLLIPCSFLLGAGFLALCDTIGRTAAAPAEIPVGVITAMAGGPFFIWMLRAKSKVVV
jgi:iron complex transport system permease protein